MDKMADNFLDNSAKQSPLGWSQGLRYLQTQSYTFFSYKNHVYKNVEAQITLKFKNVVLILLVAISISFWGSNQN